MQDLAPMYPIAEEINLDFLNASMPPESVALDDPEPALSLLAPIRKQMHGDYLALFDEILGTLAHPDNQCPAYFESVRDEQIKNARYDGKALEWCDKIADHLKESPMGEAIIQWREMNGLTVPYLEKTVAWTRQEIRKDLVLRNHDYRSLLTHSLLVMQAAQKSVEFDRDPLFWGSFKRRYINTVKDNYIKDDPLILICALAHDIGKISAYRSATRDLSDHDRLGQQIVCRLPAFFNSTNLSQEDRFILDNVLAKYHAPTKVTVDLRVNAGQNLVSHSRSNRMHRILEILIKADGVAGMIEGRAAELRRTDKVPSLLSDKQWEETLGAREDEQAKQDEREATPILPGDIATFFKELITDPNTLINADPKDMESSFGFVQADLEFGRKFLYLRVDVVLGYLKDKIGYLPENAVEFVSEALASEGLIHNPFDSALKRTKFWTWFVQLYYRDTFIRKRNDGIEEIRYENLKDYEGGDESAKLGPLFMVDLEQANEACDTKVKAYPKPWRLYGVLVDSGGQGFTSPWKNGAEKLIEERVAAKKRIAEGGDTDFVVKTAEEVKTPAKPAASSSENKVKSPKPSKRKTLSADNEIEALDDFLIRE